MKGNSNPDTNRFLSRTKATLVATSVVGMILLATVFEIALRPSRPVPVECHGDPDSVNARRYGWGHKPYESIHLVDPDTNEIFGSRANNHGWRDKDRDFKKDGNVYRILVLGDSHTFGIIVRDEDIYTRVLERRLLSEGYNVELISLAETGFGTDQQFEALRLEGLKYNPDLVVFQFCFNDLEDISAFDKLPLTQKGAKPFYYSLENTNQLARHPNPHYSPHESAANMKPKGFVRQSELYQHLARLYRRCKSGDCGAGIQTANTVYRFDKRRLENLKLVLQLNDDHPLFDALRKIAPEKPGTGELKNLIAKSGMEAEQDTILTILKSWWLRDLWTPGLYSGMHTDLNSPKWQLYFALMLRANDLVQQQGASLAILSETDVAFYEWGTSWYFVGDNADTRNAYLSYNHRLNSFCRENKIGFVKNTVPYQRAQNDPHLNKQGNASMADDLYQYLMTHHIQQLPKKKTKVKNR
jgi:hypothetical protein